MRNTFHVRLTAILFVFCCAIIPAGSFAQQSTTPVDIDQLTAPIALYPDALIYQILSASKSVDTVMKFASWMKENAKLKGSELQAAAQKTGFTAPYVALAPFPEVVKLMAEKPDWTKALGGVYTANPKSIDDSIQRLREQAKAAGNLQTTPQQQVTSQATSDGTTIIIIEPANPEVIYVPVYNPTTVYVAAPPPAYPTTGAAMAIGFTAGVIIGAASDNSYYGWRYDDYWDNREDFYENRSDYYEDRYEDRADYRDDHYENRQETSRQNQDQRQSTAQGNQSERQSTAQGSQSERQSTAQENQSNRQSTDKSSQSSKQSTAQENSGNRQSTGQSNQSSRQSTAQSNQGNRQSTAQSNQGNRQSAGGYQNGAATRTQSSRGSSSLSSSRGGGGGGGRRR